MRAGVPGVAWFIELSVAARLGVVLSARGVSVVRGRKARRRRLLDTTNTELNAIAPPAMIGLGTRR